MSSRLILFDIDLTILKTGGAGLRAMSDALRKFTGTEGDVIQIRPDGKTDPLIVPELFAANNLPFNEKDYSAFMDLYLEHLDREQENQKDWMLFPGVETLIQKLHDYKDTHLALVTGNDERGARLKLAPFDLNRFFPVGGFASDSAIRHELIPIAIERAEKYYNTAYTLDNVVVIGDSEGDVIGANMAGVSCIAVLTGYTDREALQNTGSCTIVQDLADTDMLFKILSQ